MRLTFLGTGAAGGVPRYGCACPACARARQDPRCVRRPCSALVEAGDTRILIDAGLTDLHERFPPGSLTAIVLTHYHPDHVQGLFHLRWGVARPIPVHGPPDPEGCADLYRNPGLLDFRALAAFQPLALGALRLTPLPLAHSKPTFGYAIESTDGGRIAYLTDTRGLPPQTQAFLDGWGDFELVLDCSFPPGGNLRNHNDWDAALAIVAALRPRHTWLTHIDHALDAWLLENSVVLQRHLSLGRDGLVIRPDRGRGEV